MQETLGERCNPLLVAGCKRPRCVRAFRAAVVLAVPLAFFHQPQDTSRCHGMQAMVMAACIPLAPACIGSRMRSCQPL